MRLAFYKCPNHIGCLTGYHGDDVPVTGDAAAICPECGTPLRQLPRARSDLFFHMANLVGVAAVAGAIWFSWPSLVKIWHKVTTPPPKHTPAGGVRK